MRWFIEQLLEEELEAALGRGRHERGVGSNGRRHGHRARQLVTTFGSLTLSVPCAWLAGEAGEQEWKSALLPAYKRLSHRAAALIAEAYLAGMNTRRVRRALAKAVIPPRRGASLKPPPDLEDPPPTRGRIVRATFGPEPVSKAAPLNVREPKPPSWSMSSTASPNLACQTASESHEIRPPRNDCAHCAFHAITPLPFNNFLAPNGNVAPVPLASIASMS